ncbi:MAG: protein TonB [Candidatus Endobugula sp.]|jgi:protein TonB
MIETRSSTPYSASSINAYHWILAAIVALLIHAVLLAAYNPVDKPLGAQSAGIQGIEIGLRTLAPSVKKMAAVSHNVTSAQKKQLTLEKQAVEKKVIKKKQVKKRITKKKLTPKKIPSQKITAAVPIKKLEEVKAEEVAEEVPEEDNPKQSAATSTIVDITESTETTTEATLSTSASDRANNPMMATAGGGDKNYKIAYERKLLAWLEQHKHYPNSARRRRQEDTVTLAFIIDKTGQVLSYEITSPSHYNKLNKAVISMIEKANPLPAIPTEMVVAGTGTLRFSVPIMFTLR